MDVLGEREREVLRAVVQEFIATGGPVGSSQLARRAEFEVSSATMRNVMSDLEELGYLDKPHASAGRVPTDRGYRFYVDSLVRLREPAAKERELICQSIAPDAQLEDALQGASKLLSQLSHHAGLVMSPRAAATVFDRVEFIRLREDRVLAVLIDQKGQVQNRAFTVDFPLTSEDLIRASNYLSELLHELPLEDLHARIETERGQELALYDALKHKALRLGAAATDRPSSERVFIEGTGTLLENPEFADVERMRALLRALEEKNKLLALLDRVQRAKEMQIYIGAESAFSSAAGEVTVIASPYGVGEQTLGAVGVIGPTRMNYQRIIPLVRFTAETISALLGR